MSYWSERWLVAKRPASLKVAFKAMVVVGILLNVIHLLVLPLWLKLVITPIIPFCVALYGTVEAQVRE